MAATVDVMRLWFWPWEAAKMATNLMETAVATQAVLAKRLPLLSAAMANPWTADHSELSLMVSEKVDAFGLSQRSITKAGEVMRKAATGNVGAFTNAANGGLFGPAEWMKMFERTVAFGSAFVALPMQALAPVHKGVTANAKRLTR